MSNNCDHHFRHFSQIQPLSLKLHAILLHCAVSEAVELLGWSVGWCGGERFTDKQSVTGPLSQVRTEGRAYSSARDKVSHDETDKQHWWRLHTISLCSPSGLSPALIFPFLPLHTQAAFICLTQCQVFTIFIFVPLKAIRFVFKHLCLPAARARTFIFFLL